MPWMKRSPSLLELATAPAAACSPRKPQETVVWQVTQQHWLDFRAETHRRADGPRIAGFVEVAQGVLQDARSDGHPVFVPLRGPTNEEVQRIAEAARRRTLRWLVRQGVVHPDEETCAEEQALADGDLIRAWFTKAAILDRIAIGDRAGQLVARLQEDPFEAWKMRRRCAMVDGFNIHANVRVAPKAREQLEKLCNYILRPALCAARLELLGDGRILAKLKRRWSDGTWAKIFEPKDFLAKITALMPRPGVNLLRYHGQFAPQGKWRDKIVIGPLRRKRRKASGEAEASAEDKRWRLSWAELLKRTFGFEVLQCPRCQGRRELIALIKKEQVVTRILDHVGIPSAPPRFVPARSVPPPPWEAEWQAA